MKNTTPDNMTFSTKIRYKFAKRVETVVILLNQDDIDIKIKRNAVFNSGLTPNEQIKKLTKLAKDRKAIERDEAFARILMKIVGKIEY